MLNFNTVGGLIMVILGIDPGTAIVGFGIVEYINKTFTVLDYGCIYTEKDMEMPKRLNIIYEELNNLIKKYKPEYIAIEDIFYFKNNKTVISVSQARGVILLCAEQNNLKISAYTPLQVKMGITGYGRSEKKQIQKMVQRILKLKEIPKPDDAADALAIAVTHINELNSKLSMYSNNISVKKIKNIPNKITASEFKNLFAGEKK
jgi:crossover junction endodeoxyribonuclease RuvC